MRREKLQRYNKKREEIIRRNGEFHTKQEWKELCLKYNNQCLACKQTGVKLTRDHIIPLSQGGTDRISNVQPLCGTCNSLKGSKSTDYRLNFNE